MKKETYKKQPNSWLEMVVVIMTICVIASLMQNVFSSVKRFREAPNSTAGVEMHQNKLYIITESCTEDFDSVESDQ